VSEAIATLQPMSTADGIGPLTPEQASIAAASLDLAAGDLVAVHNGILTKVHPASLCAGEPSWVHNPSAHHMSTWPIYWNAGSRTAVRICSHDFDHPDPDDVAYNEGVGRDVSKHECDGCWIFIE
jgi:hypothetical protein